MKLQELRQIIREEISKSLKESQPEVSILKEYVLIVWESDNYIDPNVIIIFTSDNKSDLEDLPKGELADTIEREIKQEISPDDFETDLMSKEDFIEEYLNPKNPRKILLRNTLIKDMSTTNKPTIRYR